MNLSSIAIAIQGLGFGSLLMAGQGLLLAQDNTQPPVVVIEEEKIRGGSPVKSIHNAKGLASRKRLRHARQQKIKAQNNAIICLVTELVSTGIIK